jgi:hypothetical protein
MEIIEAQPSAKAKLLSGLAAVKGVPAALCFPQVGAEGMRSLWFET